MARVWTEEQKQEARDRMAKARAARKPKQEAVAVAVKERSPEVEAVIATMSPERKAKLAGIQARQMAQLAQTKEGQEALDRMKARHTVTTAEEYKPEVVVRTVVADPVKVFDPLVPLKAPFRITGSQSGMCVSEMGKCWCGKPQLEWHPICLKVRP